MNNKITFEFETQDELYNFIIDQIMIEKIKFKKEIIDIDKNINKKILYKQRIKMFLKK